MFDFLNQGVKCCYVQTPSVCSSFIWLTWYLRYRLRNSRRLHAMRRLCPVSSKYCYGRVYWYLCKCCTADIYIIISSNKQAKKIHKNKCFQNELRTPCRKSIFQTESIEKHKFHQNFHLFLYFRLKKWIQSQFDINLIIWILHKLKNSHWSRLDWCIERYLAL